MTNLPELILASASPRRAELLTLAGFAFTVDPADVDETQFPGEPPIDYVRRVAGAKAETVASRHPGRVVLAADTTVVAHGRTLAKPADAADARVMLQLLSGGVHDVHTGVVVRLGTREQEAVVTTRVHVLALTADEIDWYVGSGEHDGKAGAYGIQGRFSRFVDRIEGSWPNVVGLPVASVYELILRLAVG